MSHPDSSTPTALQITLPAARIVTRRLCSIVFVLVALSTTGQLLKYVAGHPNVKGFVPLFYVDLESNIPTWYSSAALALAALLLLLVAEARRQCRDPYYGHWGLLSLLCFALSADEISMLHEYPIEPLRDALGAGGLLYYTWVLPGMALVVATGVAFWRFVKALPAITRRQFLLAAAVFCSGALGIEMLSGWQADHFGEETLGYALIVTAEETCEMMGVVIFIHAVLAYLQRTMPAVTLHVAAPAAAATRNSGS